MDNSIVCHSSELPSLIILNFVSCHGSFLSLLISWDSLQFVYTKMSSVTEVLYHQS